MNMKRVHEILATATCTDAERDVLALSVLCGGIHVSIATGFIPNNASNNARLKSALQELAKALGTLDADGRRDETGAN